MKFSSRLTYGLVCLVLFCIGGNPCSAGLPAAAVTWVLYNNRPGFKQEPAIIQSLLHPPEGGQNIFNIPAAGVLPPLSVESGLDDFSLTVKRALSLLDGSGPQEPTLFVIIGSHGNIGRIGHQGQEDILHKNFVEALFREVDDFRKNSASGVKVQIIYNACRSGSMIPYLQNRAARGYKVDFISSSSSDSDCASGYFWTYFELLASAKLQGVIPNDSTTAVRGLEVFDSIADLAPISGTTSPQIWSSYREIKETNLDGMVSWLINLGYDELVSRWGSRALPGLQVEVRRLFSELESHGSLSLNIDSEMRLASIAVVFEHLSLTSDEKMASNFILTKSLSSDSLNVRYWAGRYISALGMGNEEASSRAILDYYTDGRLMGFHLGHSQLEVEPLEKALSSLSSVDSLLSRELDLLEKLRFRGVLRGRRFQSQNARVKRVARLQSLRLFKEVLQRRALSDLESVRFLSAFFDSNPRFKMNGVYNSMDQGARARFLEILECTRALGARPNPEDLVRTITAAENWHIAE